MSSDGTEILPTDFDSKSFLQSIVDLKKRLEPMTSCQEDLPIQELDEVVGAGNATMAGFNIFSVYSQQQLEELRFDLEEIIRWINGLTGDPSTEISNLKKAINRMIDTSIDAELAAFSAAVAAKNAEQQAVEAAEKAKEEENRRVEEANRKAIEEKERIEAGQKAKEEEEQKRREAEQKAMEEKERKRREAERKAKEDEMADESKWPVYKYEVSPGRADQGIVCLLWGDAPEFKQENVECRVLPQIATNFTLDNNQQLLSNIVQLSPTHPDYVLEKAIHVAIPFHLPRPPVGREAVVVAETSDGKWTTVETKEVSFRRHKNMKFARAEVRELTTLAVVTRPKRDSLVLPNCGGKVTSSLDIRITFSAEPNTFEHDEALAVQVQMTPCKMQDVVELSRCSDTVLHFLLGLQCPVGIQPVETSDVSNLNAANTTSSGLLACSSMVEIEWKSETFNKAVEMTLPCPAYTGKVTSKGAEKAKMTAKKSQNTAKIGSDADNEDVENEVLYLVHKSPKKGWKILPVVVEQPKHDLTQFQLEQPVNSLMVLRTKPTVTGPEAERLARAMEENLNQKQVITIVRQSNKDSSDVTVHVVQPVDVEETMKKLNDAGYDDGPACSPAFMLMEGDELEVSFRSNVKSCDAVKRLQEIYNSPVSTSINFTVQVDDKYLQKIYPMYQGFVQLFKKEKTSVQKSVKDNDGETRRETVFEYKRVLLCEVLIQIPKDIDLATRSLTTAPVKIIGRRDGLNEELLRHLAHQLDDEWEKLVKHLGVSKTTVNNSKKSVKNRDGRVDDVKFEVLVAWIKTQPREVSQVETLQDALEKSGRGNLASGLCDMVERFRDNKGQ